MASLGPTVLSEGTAPICADVVFVHGLRGDPFDTWTKDSIVWPRDILPSDLRNARIITWGYDASIMQFFEKTGQSSIFSHALTLLQDVQRERKTKDEKARRLIFVAHSLGGLVALCKSHEYNSTGRSPRIAGILSSVCGVVFVGTPHRGSDQTSWASIATNLAKLLQKDHNDRIIAALTRGSEVLEGLQDSFAGILEKFTIYSVLEEKGIAGIGKVVHDNSAVLGVRNENLIYIPADHREMCKFSKCTDIGYRRLSGALLELIEDLESTSNAPMNAPGELYKSVEKLTISPRPGSPARSLVQVNPNSGPSSQSEISPSAGALVGNLGGVNSVCRAVHDDQLEAIDALVNSNDFARIWTLVKKHIPCSIDRGWTQYWVDYWGIDWSQREMTILHCAVENSGENSLSILRLLLDSSPASDHDAIGFINLVEAMNKCRRMGRQPFLAQDDDNRMMQRVTILTWAAILGNVEAVQLLVRTPGVDINSRQNWLRVTPLMAQCFLAVPTDRALQVTSVLLDAGAQLDLQDNRGNTALHLALFMKNSALVMLLLNAGASVDIPNYDNSTVYDHCVTYGSTPEVQAAVQSRRGQRTPGYTQGRAAIFQWQ
ncbi:hypothetical protein V502_00216 [Pseudogymnoascus sp. VKM F-4520 (FW-2644)]|nr:hypothetical protein V502_00216 [Pseudogymnoascus sp. VKM F-4520 (FW-2644)]